MKVQKEIKKNYVAGISPVDLKTLRGGSKKPPPPPTGWGSSNSWWDI
jgi:hypothetical protein